MAETNNPKQSNKLHARQDKVWYDTSLITDQDIYLFKEGNHFQLYGKFGAHVTEFQGVKGTYFAVWAPNAKKVSIIGNFNYWDRESHPLAARWDSSGIFEGFIPHLGQGEIYKIFIESHVNDYKVEKRDPFAFANEISPKTASVVWDLDYKWSDGKWMQNRCKYNSLEAPISIYEIHLGSWKRVPEEGNRFQTYREIAKDLVDYVKQMGFTHVELMPIMEHPFYGSWGYQITGYFAPTNRYGSVQDFMYLVDHLHQNNIGVILDWVPSHFPSDEHGLGFFDGTHLFEHSDPRLGFHPDWKCCIFNHGRYEVKEFLISSALFWLEKYHIDGLRVDAVASMLYLDYSRNEGEWIPNQYGGRENLESMQFIKRLNEVVYERFPDVQMIAEESTAWPGVSRPVSHGGLGFGLKWNMGWMHDTLLYFSKDPVYRKYHHNDLTFSFLYVFSENYLLSLSHDEVVHGKGSLINRMPCDDWQKFANLRLLFGYMFAHPGKKLMFMGGEFGQWSEWNHEKSLDWHLAGFDRHRGVQRWVEDLNKMYRSEPALYKIDFHHAGMQWIDGGNYEHGVLTFIRRSGDPKDEIVIVCNFTPETWNDYRIGIPQAGYWKELLNSDSSIYWGSGQGNMGGRQSQGIFSHGFENSISLKIPPMGMLFLKKS